MHEQGLLRILNALGSPRVKRSGSRLLASCPFAPYRHAKGTDRNPSFSIEINSSGPSPYKCWSCGVAGKKTISLLYAWKDATGTWKSDLHAFIRDEEGGSLREQLDRLGGYSERRRHAIGHPGESHWHVAGYERKFSAEDIAGWAGTVPRYALQRGVTFEQCQQWELGYDREGQRLVIPIRDEHQRLVGYSRRAIHPDSEPKYLHAKGMLRDRYLYGEHRLDPSCRKGLLMEGFFDVWAFDRRGYRNALATMGTALSTEHILKMRKWFDRVTIFPHNDPKPDPKPISDELTDDFPIEAGGKDAAAVPDPPGQKMAREYRDALTKAGIEVAIAPVMIGRKDPGEWQESDWLLLESHVRLGPVLNELKRGIEAGRKACETEAT